jgi:hypothetical protein
VDGTSFETAGPIMNFSSLLRAFDTVVVLREAARRFTSPSAQQPPVQTGLAGPAAGTALSGQIEARLTGVVVAALKEAFDRDHARLELERVQLEDQRRRADEALRAELRRQAADREVARLRLMSGTALGGWVAAMALMVVRLEAASVLSRAVSAVGWLLLLAALGTAFLAQGRVSAAAGGVTGSSSMPQPVDAGRSGMLALWLMVAGLACAGIALLL